MPPLPLLIAPPRFGSQRRRRRPLLTVPPRFDLQPCTYSQRRPVLIHSGAAAPGAAEDALLGMFQETSGAASRDKPASSTAPQDWGRVLLQHKAAMAPPSLVASHATSMRASHDESIDGSHDTSMDASMDESDYTSRHESPQGEPVSGCAPQPAGHNAEHVTRHGRSPSQGQAGVNARGVNARGVNEGGAHGGGSGGGGVHVDGSSNARVPATHSCYGNAPVELMRMGSGSLAGGSDGCGGCASAYEMDSAGGGCMMQRADGNAYPGQMQMGGGGSCDGTMAVYAMDSSGNGCMMQDTDGNVFLGQMKMGGGGSYGGTMAGCASSYGMDPSGNGCMVQGADGNTYLGQMQMGGYSGTMAGAGTGYAMAPAGSGRMMQSADGNAHLGQMQTGGCGGTMTGAGTGYAMDSSGSGYMMQSADGSAYLGQMRMGGAGSYGSTMAGCASTYGMESSSCYGYGGCTMTDGSSQPAQMQMGGGGNCGGTMAGAPAEYGMESGGYSSCGGSTSAYGMDPAYSGCMMQSPDGFAPAGQVQMGCGGTMANAPATYTMGLGMAPPSMFGCQAQDMYMQPQYSCPPTAYAHPVNPNYTPANAPAYAPSCAPSLSPSFSSSFGSNTPAHPPDYTLNHNPPYVISATTTGKRPAGKSNTGRGGQLSRQRRSAPAPAAKKPSQQTSQQQPSPQQRSQQHPPRHSQQQSSQQQSSQQQYSQQQPSQQQTSQPQPSQQLWQDRTSTPPPIQERAVGLPGPDTGGGLGSSPIPRGWAPSVAMGEAEGPDPDTRGGAEFIQQQALVQRVYSRDSRRGKS